jgi:hypothetical protein
MKKSSKWHSQKRIMGVLSFTLFVLLSVLDANDIVIVPTAVLGMFSGIAATWLVMEGLIDSKKINSAASRR